MGDGLTNVLLLVPVFLFSLSAHEFAHAWTAVRRGDRTPLDAGRLSMHPMAHADLVGTLILPTLCIYYGFPFFGWAKPVPIDARNFRNFRWDTALVAMAGPVSNLVLALLATAGLGLIVRVPNLPGNLAETLQLFGVVAIQVNIALAVFNLLPIPPLDGFNIIQAILPDRVVARLAGFGQIAAIGLMIVMFSGGLRFISIPVSYLFRLFVGWIS